MSVLFDARPLTIASPGGVSRIARLLLPALAQSLSDRSCVFGTTGSRKLELDVTLPSNSHHEHVSAPNKLISAGTTFGALSFDQLFSTQKPEVLFLPNLGHVGRPKIPYGLLVHDLSFLVEPKWFSARGQIWHKAVHAERLIKEATRLFAVSKWTKQALSLHLNIPAEKIDVIEVPIDPSSVTGTIPEHLQGKPYVLCLGGKDRRKNVDCIVEAVKNLPIDLVIVGGYTGPLTPRMHILPRVDDKTLSALYKSASVFAYPSWYEGFGLPLHEAASFGTPCVSSSTSALPDCAPANTLFVPPNKPHLWIQALESALNMPRTIAQKRERTESSFDSILDFIKENSRASSSL